jgi:hypothetical protein
VVNELLRRLGTSGVILLASLLFFAILGGVTVAHRLQAASTANTATTQHQAGVGDQDDQGDQVDNSEGKTKPKHSNHSHGASAKPGENAGESD